MTPLTEAGLTDAGLLVVRLVFGPYLFAQGAQKMFGWFRGMGFEKATKMMESFGYRPGGLFVRLAALTQIAGSVLITLGLFGPIGPALMVSVMIVAAASIWPLGYFAVTGGIELPVLYATAGVGLAVVGPGRLSLDHALGLDALWTSRLVWMALLIGVLGGLANVATRRKPAPAAPGRP